MTDRTISGGGSLLSFYVILGLVAMVITKDIFVGLAVIVYGWVMCIPVLIALIPFVGVFLQYIVASSVSGMLISYMAIPATVGTVLSIGFWIPIILGILITMYTTLLVINKLR